MIRTKVPRCLLILLILTLSGTLTSYAMSDADLEGVRLTELRKVAEEVRKIIATKDVPALLTLVRPDIRPDFERDLSNPSSALYRILFDSEALGHLSNPNLPSVSVRDFLLRKNPKIRVSFYADADGKKRLDWAYVIYSSPSEPQKDWPSMTFVHSSGRWWLTQVLSD